MFKKKKEIVKYKSSGGASVDTSKAFDDEEVRQKFNQLRENIKKKLEQEKKIAAKIIETRDLFAKQ